MRKQLRFLTLLTALMGATALSAQDVPAQTAVAAADWRDALRDWLTAEDLEDDYGTAAMEQLEDMAAAPLNVNQLTREELEQLPFLTDQQVEGIMAYVYRYGPVRSLSELQMVTSLDRHTRQLLGHFLTVGSAPARSTWPRLKDVLHHGKHALTATVRVPCYTRQGDANGYLGYKYRHELRYQFTYGDRLKAGITGAQDAGEPFLSASNPWGYDHYAWYLQLRKAGRLEELNVGTYRVQMGLGLVMNTGLNLGKWATLQQLGRTTHALTAHTSRSEDYLQGAAATVRLTDRWRLTAFGSVRQTDATLNANGTARTLLTDGYHRTPTEMGKKHNTLQADAGTTIGWRKGTAHVSANAVWTHFDRRLMPQKTSLYRRYAAEGNDFVNVSADYGYSDSTVSVSGETALNRQGALAAIHTASLRLSRTLTVMALHRYYATRYTALHSRSFAEGSSVQNEHGAYLGATWLPSRQWMVQGYADYAHFSWPRYLATAPSDAADVMVAVRHTHKSWTAEGRYRLHVRQRDNTEHTLLLTLPEHRLRMRWTLDASPQLTLSTQADGVTARTRNGGGAFSKGIMVSQRVRWQWRWLRADASVGWFRTDGYDARLYQYESSVRYDYAFPAYYGHGLRYALTARADAGHKLTVAAKLATTNYFDRATVGTALQQVGHSSLTDATLQLHYKF